MRNVLIIMAAAFCALLILSGGWAMVPAVAGVFLFYRHLAEKSFGGVSGDLAGWFLQTAELWMLGAWCLQQYLRL